MIVAWVCRTSGAGFFSAIHGFEDFGFFPPVSFRAIGVPGRLQSPYAAAIFR